MGKKIIATALVFMFGLTAVVSYYEFVILHNSFYLPITVSGTVSSAGGLSDNATMKIDGGVTIDSIQKVEKDDNYIYAKHNDENITVFVPQRNRITMSSTANSSSEVLGKIKPEQLEVAQKVALKLKEAGYNDIAIAGILGNIQAESGMRVDAIESNGEGFGLCQWSFGRKEAVKNYCVSHGYEITSVEGQTEYLIYELEHEKGWINGLKSEGLTLNEYKNIGDIDYATELFCWKWERPNSKFAHLDVRKESARAYYNALGGQGGITMKGVKVKLEAVYDKEQTISCAEHSGKKSYPLLVTGTINNVKVSCKGYYCVTSSASASGGEGTVAVFHATGYWGTKVGKGSANDLAAAALAEWEEGQADGTSHQGGDKYWSWYGFNNHVHWCACFVSYCAEQCGYLERGIMRKYAACTESAWYKQTGQYMLFGAGTPQPGYIAFYGPNGTDHTGIVVEIKEDGTIVLVEGNLSNKCTKIEMNPVTGDTDKGRDDIHGFGIPDV